MDVSGGVSEQKRSFPKPIETLLGAQQLALRSIINAKLKFSAPDLLIRPAVGLFQVLDFRQMDEILAASAEAKEQVRSALTAASGGPDNRAVSSGADGEALIANDIVLRDLIDQRLSQE